MQHKYSTFISFFQSKRNIYLLVTTRNFLFSYFLLLFSCLDLNYCTVKKVNMKKEYEGCIHQVDEKKRKTIRHTLVDKGIKYNANI